MGDKFGICIDSAGSLYGWGSNGNGELALGDYEPRANINQIVTLQNKIIKDFSCGGNFVIALGNTLNKKIEENNAINEENREKMNNFNKLSLNFHGSEQAQKNNSSMDYFDAKKVKSQHIKGNHSIGDFREDSLLNFKSKNANNAVKYLTNEEIKNRQKASLYESPNRLTDK